MVRAVASFLERKGWEVSLAHYMPWSEAPGLSVRFPGLGNDEPEWRVRSWEGRPEVDAYEIGVRYPEFEWRRYRLNGGWRRAIEDHDVHLVVSGTVLPANPIVEAGLPCLAWVATRYWPDKRDRLGGYSWGRQVYDLTVNTPVGLRLERKLAREADLLALSSYTAREFEPLIGGTPPVMPMGVDAERFYPPRNGTRDSGEPYEIGFVGRLSDPRKNVSMLADVLARLCRDGADVCLRLVGGEPDDEFNSRVHEVGLSARVSVTEHMEPADLADFYRDLDVFVLPSRQEGLAIVGLEAMACGCPVVSTRCGGPEDYVEDGRNGFLVGFDGAEMARAVNRILEEPGLRPSMSEAAVATVRERFSRERMKDVFWGEFDRTYGEGGVDRG